MELVPLKSFSGYFAAGWRMLPGFPLEAGDWAVLMIPPNFPEIRGEDGRSNKSKGRISAWAKRLAKDAQVADARARREREPA